MLALFQLAQRLRRNGRCPVSGRIRLDHRQDALVGLSLSIDRIFDGGFRFESPAVDLDGDDRAFLLFLIHPADTFDRQRLADGDTVRRAVAGPVGRAAVAGSGGGRGEHARAGQEQNREQAQTTRNGQSSKGFIPSHSVSSEIQIEKLVETVWSLVSSASLDDVVHKVDVKGSPRRAPKRAI